MPLVLKGKYGIFMNSLIYDLKFGARLLLKEKGFAVTAIATLALCIAANAVIFSIVYSVVLKPLPFAESHRILLMRNSYPNVGVRRASNGAPDYYDRRRAVTAFEEQAFYTGQSVTIGEKGAAQQVESMSITPTLFQVLRIQPALGRNFTPEEAEIGNERKAILSYGLCQELFAGDPSAVGKEIRIYGNLHTIVGVMPKDFYFLNPRVRLWRPLAFTAEQKQSYHSNNWENIGRLKPGATIQQVQSQLDALNRANMEKLPELKPLLINAGFHTEVLPLQDDIVMDVRRTLFLLWGGVLFVLLIGAVNIANLTLARSNARLREVATRFALGSTRLRLARQLITESVLLVSAGAIAGLLLGWWGLRAFDLLHLGRLPRGNEIGMDGAVVAFVLGLSFLVGVLVGFIPVVHSFKTDINLVFRAEGRTGTSGRGARWLRNSLVVTQVGFALVLLTGAGLLLASFRQVLAIKPGFDPSQVLTGTVALPTVRYKGDPEIRAFGARALEKIRALPGIAAAGATDTIPFGGRSSDSVIFAEGYAMQPGESVVSPNQVIVTPGYFEAMKIPLIEGRFFDERDRPGSLRAIIVDRRMARKFWPGSSPIGKRMWRPSSAQDLVQPGPNAAWYTVVGVVDSVKIRALVDPDERAGAYYFPFEQQPQDLLTFAVRTSGNPAGLIPALRQAMSQVDAELPLYDIRTMDGRIDESLVERKSPMLIAVGFGVVALFLAAVGIYGVLAYTVAQRTRELGIRIALGCSMGRIFQLVLHEGLLLLALGFSAGLGGTLALARYVESILFGIRPSDAGVLGSVCVLLGAVAMFACALPARRATQIDPIAALHQE